MEEDIKILESYTTDLFHSYNGEVIIKATKNLLKAYKELELKVKRYEKYLENKDKKFEEALEYEFQERETDYIPKSKVKEKIEELKRLEGNPKEAKHYVSWYSKRIEVLQELLEEE